MYQVKHVKVENMVYRNFFYIEVCNSKVSRYANAQQWLTAKCGPSVRFWRRGTAIAHSLFNAVQHDVNHLNFGKASGVVVR